MKISASDLIYLNEAAKALKQGAFIYNQYQLIGVDMTEQYLCYTTLNNTMISIDSIEGCVFYAKELSAFCKAITTETEFEANINGIITTNTGVEMMFAYVQTIFSQAWSKYCYVINRLITTPPTITMPIDEIADKLKAMHKADGAIHEILNKRYYVTLFPGMLPMAKADKVFATFYDTDIYSFTTEYVVSKKHFQVHVIVSYLRI